ncbi:MAG: fructosamine kinase family protein [Bacteroidota bacterium]
MEAKTNKDSVKILISETIHAPVSALELTAISGGSINDTFKVNIKGGKPVFAKVNTIAGFPYLLEKERNGLEFLSKQNVITVPEIIGYGKNLHYQLLVLEWIEEGDKTQSFWKTFGEQLAGLHKINNPHSGFYEDNYMGALPQSNTVSKSWIDFFIGNRLQPQVELASRNGFFSPTHISAFDKLSKKLDNIFDKEKPSLLHGDLWSGNVMSNANNQPVLIDTAVYFGNRSMDLAMTTLFGGFDKFFYDSYNYHFPFSYNYQDQWKVCNLYPLLIHLNLFGTGYLQNIESILKKFTA